MAYILREYGVEESFGKDKQTVVRKFYVDPWSARAEFVADVGGGVRQIGDIFFRQLPARDPDYPWLFASDIKIKPFDEDPGSLSLAITPLNARANYVTADATVTYTNLDNEQQDSKEKQQTTQDELDLGTVNWDFSARALKLPNQWFIWRDAVAGANMGLVANSDTGVTKVYPGLQIVVTRHLLPRTPFNAIIGQLGRINQHTFTIAGDVYPKETLRFDAAKRTRKYTNRGVKFFELSYTFAIQPMYDSVTMAMDQDFVGWNRLFNPRLGYWQFVRTNTAPSKGIYEYDEDGPTQTFGGQVQKGFTLLFDPRAN